MVKLFQIFSCAWCFGGVCCALVWGFVVGVSWVWDFGWAFAAGGGVWEGLEVSVWILEVCICSQGVMVFVFQVWAQPKGRFGCEGYRRLGLQFGIFCGFGYDVEVLIFLLLLMSLRFNVTRRTLWWV